MFLLLMMIKNSTRLDPPTVNNWTKYMKPLLSATRQQVAQDCDLQEKGEKCSES